MTKLMKFFYVIHFIFALLFVDAVFADETDLFTVQVKPNILFILDNSNSMDEDFYGNAVGSFSSSSKSVNGKNALIGLVNTYVDKTRMGIMTYRLSSASKDYLHNSPYFASYEPKSYCPTPPAECVEYCRTGNTSKRSTCQSTCSSQNSVFDADYFDGIISHYTIGSEERDRYCGLVYPKTQRIPNPTDTANYIYYKQALPFYASSNQGTAFCYSGVYNSAEKTPYDAYSCYRSKTGTSDINAGYSSLFSNSTFTPTDSDYALGYYDFGRRMYWYYAGRAWYANGSPGDGYLQIAIDTNNPSNNSHKTNLSTKLDPKSGDETGYMSCTSLSNPNTCSYIVNAGLTPTAGTLQSAFNYFSGGTSPIQYSCQKNFIVYVTDGLPSVNESGVADTATNLMPTVLTKLTALHSINKTLGSTPYNFDINTYVLGMGLTADAKTTLDQMAVKGNTAVSGHAFYADDPLQLSTSLNSILNDIIEKSYAFTAPSVSSMRIVDENYLYEASFEPKNGTSFWPGHLKKFQINTDGSINNVAVWDAGTELSAITPSARKIVTYLSGGITQFEASNSSLTNVILNVSSNADRTATIGYVRGESTYTLRSGNEKLGDIFHSNIVTIGTPSAFFNDIIDKSSTNAFEAFRSDHTRTSTNGLRIVIAGANDGQFHAFTTKDGKEFWSFIPPNLLSRLNDLRTGTNHLYLVDGPVIAADVWLGSGDGSAKSKSDWTTMAVVSEGRGGSLTLWSSSSSCDSGFSTAYSATYPYYCGYYAFDFTDTLNPGYKWRIRGSASAGLSSDEGDYLGEPWSKMIMGRVIINGNEKWVGFIGAGYNDTDCSSGNSCDTRGKGFYVIDLIDGKILWKFTRANSSGMDFSMPAMPAIVDTDNDGFIDAAYLGDLGGNVWKFKFCSRGQTSCGVSNWTGSMFFEHPSGSIRPIYTPATVARDTSGNLWVYWGTGDKVNLTVSNSQEKIYAVKDVRTCSNNAMCGYGGTCSIGTGTCKYSLNSLKNITSGVYSPSSTEQGWYINLNGEKMLSEPTVFGGVLYFTTYKESSGGDPCNQAGKSYLYGVNSTSGAGVMTNSGDRSSDIGSGLSSSPAISLKPASGTVDLYVTTSGSPGQNGGTVKVNYNPPAGVCNNPPCSNLIYWRDRRLQ